MTLPNSMHHHLTKYFTLVILLCFSAKAEEISSFSREEAIGKVFLILSRDYAVTGQDDSLWVNAKLGSVENPNYKSGTNSPMHFRQMVPTDSGLVLNFSSAFDPERSSTAIFFSDIDAEKHTFKVVIPLHNNHLVMITGHYGSNFSLKHVGEIMALGVRSYPVAPKQLPANENSR